MNDRRQPWRPGFAVAPVAVAAVVLVLVGRAAAPVKAPEALQVGEGVVQSTNAHLAQHPAHPHATPSAAGNRPAAQNGAGDSASTSADSPLAHRVGTSRSTDPTAVTVVNAPQQVVVTDDGGSDGSDDPSPGSSWKPEPSSSATSNPGPSSSGSPSQSPDE
jgi:hypothetical protein